jgi:ankyrin repeat protein
MSWLLVVVRVVASIGETPLHLAVQSGKTDVVSALMQFGADPFISGPNGTAREVAFLQNFQALADQLAGILSFQPLNQAIMD